MKLKSKTKKTAFYRDLNVLDRQIKAAETELETIINDRLKLLTLDKK